MTSEGQPNKFRCKLVNAFAVNHQEPLQLIHIDSQHFFKAKPFFIDSDQETILMSEN
jgi:hypothetical protein